MGMSSSQARLLTLTARQHSIEHKAQKIQADKLRLANESDRVYNDYLEALDATKIQYKSINNDGTTTYIDATMNAMQNGIIGNWNGETSNEILFLQGLDGKVLITPAVAQKYGLTSTATETRDMDTFIEQTTGKTKSERPTYGFRDVTDTSVITGSTKISNVETKQPTNTENHTYTPVENIEGGIDYSALESYAKFNESHSASTAGATEITAATTNLTAGTTYTITSAEGLKKLSELSNTSGVTIVLANDIDMSGVTGWEGIKNFQGTFDGNGHKITNLTGTNGLFASTSGATIKNIGLENININGNSDYVGGLIGSATDSIITNCYTTGSIKNTNSNTITAYDNSKYTSGTGGLIGNVHTSSGKTTTIDNVYSSADVTATSSDGVGGLIGTTGMNYGNTVMDIKNAYAIGNVSGKNSVGGFIGASYNDQDNSSDITDIRNCYSGGKVSGSNYVGGFAGLYLYWGDRGDYCEIEGCNSTGKVNGSTNSGAFMGIIVIKNADSGDDHYYVNFKDCGYSQDTGAAKGYGDIKDTDFTTSRADLVQNSGASDGLVFFKMAGSIPSMNDYKQNIIAALTKADVYDACDPELTTADKNAMNAKIEQFLAKFTDNDTDNAKLWYLNKALCEYLKGTGSNDLGAKLGNDINNGTTTSTASFQTGAKLDGSVKRSVDSNTTVVNGTHNKSKGEITIPSTSNIADQLYYTLREKGKSETEITQAQVQSWINNNYSTSNADDKVILANINDSIQQGKNLDAIYSAIKNNTKYTDTTNYNKDEWNINFAGSQTITPTYGKTQEKYQTGTEKYWDTTDKDIANAIAMYAMSKRGVTVVTEEQAANVDFLTNMVTEGQAVFTTFDPSQVQKLADLTEAQINAMTDKEYEEMMGIVNTSVATNTSLREVSNEINVKKAEAKYEADMKEINKKDTKYDTQLSACETERNAIKEEIDSLKNVIKDNVDLTFKLFS